MIAVNSFRMKRIIPLNGAKGPDGARILGRLTVKLRGRPEAPDQAPRAHNLFRARGADTQAVHGPLQRLLDGNAPRTEPLPKVSPDECGGAEYV
jgi:hypothetical protein